MVRSRFSAPRGTRDILPPESTRRHRLEGCFADLAGRSGFGLVELPVFEDAAVFMRLGEATEVVAKELFEFDDKGSPPQRLALRPELTAGVCRAFAQHRPVVPWKVWYHGPQFRYERPQAGRYRQFSQIGAEMLGTADPHADVEMIALGLRLCEALGLQQVRLLLNTLGDAASRSVYKEALTEYLIRRRGDLTEQSRTTLERNPMRVLDSKRPEDEPVIAEAPVMADFLSGESAAHFEAVRTGLRSVSVEYELSPRLVRGLDYYTRTVFEFAADALGTAQNAVGGGGRYDGLVEDMGGPPTPGIGMALGVDRILMACDAEGVFGSGLGTDETGALQVFVVDVTGGAEAVMICDRLRHAGLAADHSFDGRSMKAQMKLANRSGARVAVIVGPDEKAAGVVTVRDLRGHSGQRRVPASDAVAEVVDLVSPSL